MRCFYSTIHKSSPILYAYTDLFQTSHLHLSTVKHPVHPTATILVSQPRWRLHHRSSILHPPFTTFSICEHGYSLRIGKKIRSNPIKEGVGAFRRLFESTRMSCLCTSAFFIRVSRHNTTHSNAHSNHKPFLINVIYVIWSDVVLFDRFLQL